MNAASVDLSGERSAATACHRAAIRRGFGHWKPMRRHGKIASLVVQGMAHQMLF